MADNTDDDEVYVLTPKGWVEVTLRFGFGLSAKDAEDFWYRLEGFAMKSVRRDYPDAPTAALVFDGEGGQIIGVEEERAESTD